MDVTHPPPRVLRFGLFELDPSTGDLARNGRKVRLQDQPLRVLTLLVDWVENGTPEPAYRAA